MTNAPNPTSSVATQADDDAEARAERLAIQRILLSNLPAWLRYRSLKQKNIANALNVSEALASRYLRAETIMPLPHIHKIAVLLGCEPGDLLKPPPADAAAAIVRETLNEIERIGPERWRRILDAAKEVRGKGD